MADLTIAATVNGRRVARQANPSQRVLDFLRDDLHMTGTKEGCGAGECGTCSVFVDGVLVKSCLLPVAKISGKKVDTIEGLAVSGEMSAVQKAFHKSGASQCGYCIPGMVMAATAALRLNPQADREEIKERLGGNICRCTGYQKIFDAVEMARDYLNGKLSPTAFDELDADDGKYIGVNVRRIDAPSKVTGALRYAGDMVLPNMLHVQVLRSPHPHARIVSIDVTDAEALPGVEAVVTCADVPGQDGFGVFVSDQPVMARDKVRYVGEPVAAVAAEDLASARRAIAKIRVEYEMLPAVFDPDEAMVAGAPVVHDYAPDNLVKHIPIRKGDVEQGFAKSDLIVEQTYETQQVEHAYLETEAGLAYVDHDGVVTVHSPRKTRRPVRLVFTREESIATTAKRHPSRTTYKMGLSRDGLILASQIRIVYDGGAYGMSTEGVIRKGAILGGGPYNIPNFQIDTYGVYTNNTPSGAFRSFGSLQSQFATESHLDICAERLGMDPFELRLKNAMRKGDQTHTKQPLNSSSMSEVLEAARTASRWENGVPNVRGSTRSDLGGEGTRPPCTLVPRAGDAVVPAEPARKGAA